MLRPSLRQIQTETCCSNSKMIVYADSNGKSAAEELALSRLAAAPVGRGKWQWRHGRHGAAADSRPSQQQLYHLT